LQFHFFQRIASLCCPLLFGHREMRKARDSNIQLVQAKYGKKVRRICHKLHGARSNQRPAQMQMTSTILYVEDDADTRELIFILLKMENYQVVVAENYDEALLLARVMRFDLYIMDNWMPGGSGIELCKRLREFDQTTPIIFYSGAAYDSDKREAFASGAQAYLTKPVDNDTLITTIAHVIAAARTIDVPARTVTVDAVGDVLGAFALQ